MAQKIHENLKVSSEEPLQGRQHPNGLEACKLLMQVWFSRKQTLRRRQEFKKFWGEVIFLKEKVEEAGLYKGNCQTVIWSWQNDSQPICELWYRDSLLEESQIGKKWLVFALLPFSIVVQRPFLKSMSWRSWRLSATLTPYSWASSGTSLWLPHLSYSNEWPTMTNFTLWSSEIKRTMTRENLLFGVVRCKSLAAFINGFQPNWRKTV